MNTNTDFKKWSNLFTHGEWMEDYSTCTTFQEYVAHKKAWVALLLTARAVKGPNPNESSEWNCLEEYEYFVKDHPQGWYWAEWIYGPGDNAESYSNCNHHELTTGCPACGASNE